MTELGVYWTSEGHIIIDLDGRQIAMDRFEAESLFVDLGHVLQDMDVSLYGDESGQTDEQPQIEGAPV